MFAIHALQKDEFDIIVLQDFHSKTFVEIIPELGGILHGFSILNTVSYLNIIDHYQNKQDFEQHVTSKGFKSCKLSPFACRIRNATYKFDNTNYQIKKFLLGENAIHGLIYDAPFSIVQQLADEERATLVLKHEYRGADAGYPFHFDCIVTYQLAKDNELIISTDIINRDKKPIPVQDGWHPYFTLGKKIDELEIQLSSLEKVIFDDTMIPTGELVSFNEFTEYKKIGSLFLDDCFRLDFTKAQPLCILRDPESKIQVEIKPYKSYPWLQLYTPPHRQSIAIENLSAPPDTFNNGIDLIILSTGESASFTTSYKISVQ